MARSIDLERRVVSAVPINDPKEEKSLYGKNPFTDFLIDVISYNRERNPTAKNPLLKTGIGLSVVAAGIPLVHGLFSYRGEVDYSDPRQIIIGVAAFGASSVCAYVAAKIFAGKYYHLYDQVTRVVPIQRQKTRISHG